MPTFLLEEKNGAYFLFRHSKAKTEMKNHLCLLFIKFVRTNNRSFFCLLFFSKKSRSEFGLGCGAGINCEIAGLAVKVLALTIAAEELVFKLFNAGELAGEIVRKTLSAGFKS